VPAQLKFHALKRSADNVEPQLHDGAGVPD